MRGPPLSCDQPYISLPESAAVLLWCRKPVLHAPNAPTRVQRAVWGPPCVDRRAGTPQTASQASLGFRPEAWVHKAHRKRRSHPSPARIGQVGAFEPATEIALWKPSETAVVGQILAGSCFFSILERHSTSKVGTFYLEKAPGHDLDQNGPFPFAPTKEIQ